MNFSEHTLLIVDDEKNTREGLRLSLEDEFDVYIAANIAEAEEVLENESVDVMLTDLRLGGENGMDLITRALAHPKPPICILMTSTSTSSNWSSSGPSAAAPSRPRSWP